MGDVLELKAVSTHSRPKAAGCFILAVFGA